MLQTLRKSSPTKYAVKWLGYTGIHGGFVACQIHWKIEIMSSLCSVRCRQAFSINIIWTDQIYTMSNSSNLNIYVDAALFSITQIAFSPSYSIQCYIENHYRSQYTQCILSNYCSVISIFAWKFQWFFQVILHASAQLFCVFPSNFLREPCCVW